ncbi:MAG TPA: cytochrome c oxidase assembly protein [Xanthobacteraceae bacterium]|nr:cytochrome c oxidase assembly protein [Xanthobacteraceae bacterium]
MTPQSPHRSHAAGRRRDFIVAGACGAVVAVMVGLSYAAVPLYDWFCRVTGFAGTTQVATRPPGQVLDRKITVRFDANVSGGLPWSFAPERTSVEVRLGEVVTMDYYIVNHATREITGIASYNVTPLNIGAYFRKINCFCFTDQTLKPGEKRAVTVVFYVDPELVADPDGRDVNTITLSYSFYAKRDSQRPTAQGATDGEPGRI